MASSILSRATFKYRPLNTRAVSSANWTQDMLVGYVSHKQIERMGDRGDPCGNPSIAGFTAEKVLLILILKYGQSVDEKLLDPKL